MSSYKKPPLQPSLGYLNTRNPWGRRSRVPQLSALLAVTGLAFYACGYNPQFVRGGGPDSKPATTVTTTKTTTTPTAKAKPQIPKPAQDKQVAKAEPVPKVKDAKPDRTEAVTKPSDKAKKLEPETPKPSADTDTDTDKTPDVATQPREAKAAAPATSVAQWCQSLADRLFSVSLSHCQQRGFVDSGYRSVKGRVIAVRNIEASNQAAIGRVLLIGGTHGDELTSVSLTFWWLDMLDASPNKIHWRVAPVMNPDGLMVDPATRVNANAVDLNRNLPTPGWREASQKYWQDVGREARRYPGDEPASEPETKWLINAVDSFKPDVIIALHAPYGVLDYDGLYPPPLQLGKLSLQRLGVFPGSLGNYGSRYLGIPVMTVELDHATRMPSREQARAMWQDLNEWLENYLLSIRKVAAEPGSNSG